MFLILRGARFGKHLNYLYCFSRRGKTQAKGHEVHPDASAASHLREIFLNCRWTDAGFLVRRTEYGNTVGMIDADSPAEIAVRCYRNPPFYISGH